MEKEKKREQRRRLYDAIAELFCLSISIFE
jgi:hypothetical protein